MKFPGKIFLLIIPCLPLWLAAQDGEAIEWSSKRLTWNDYLAQPPAMADAAAITSTALGIEYHVKNNVLSYRITSLFSKTNSWGRYKTGYILSHEQGHFDITEIFARKLAKTIEEYHFNPKTFRSDLDDIYQRIMKEKEDYQDLYDHGTDFSRNKEMQGEWLKKIAKDLEELEDWADH